MIFLEFGWEQLLLIVFVLCVAILPSVMNLILQIAGHGYFSSKKGIRIGRIFLSDDSRVRHTHVVGATGSGKTVLLEHLIFADLKRGSGAFIIDPKGDREFYERVYNYTKKIGRESDLYFLSSTFKNESVVWNPCHLGNTSELQSKFYNANIYLEPFYAKACEMGLLKAFKNLNKDKHNSITLKNLVKELENISRLHKDEILKGLFLDFSNLAESEWQDVLLPNEKKQSIDLLEIVRNNKILFVDLPTEAKKVQSQRVGRLLTQELMLISGLRKIHPELKSGKPFSIYIDEFDAFATDSFATFLNKARSSEFMIHIAHQTLSDLNRIGLDFSGQILGNCNVRFIFRQDDPDDAERWSRFIGNRRVIKRTYQSQNGSSTGASSNRAAQEFIVAPDKIKNLNIGECVFSIKTNGTIKIVKIPYNKEKSPPNRIVPFDSFDHDEQNNTNAPKIMEEKWELLKELSNSSQG